MKKILLFLNLVFLSNSILAQGEICLSTSEHDQLMKLASDVDEVCDRSIKSIVSALIIKECEKAPPSESIRFKATNPKTLRFTDYSTSYDVSKSFYYCKNETGYKSKLSTLVSQLKAEVDSIKNTKEREKHATYKENNPTAPSNPAAQSSTEPKQWACVIPGYVKMIKIVSESEKGGVEATYGTPCTPIIKK